MKAQNHSGKNNSSGAKNNKLLQKNLRQHQEKPREITAQNQDSAEWIDVTNLIENDHNRLLSADDVVQNSVGWAEKNFTDNSLGMSVKTYKDLNYFSAATTFAGLVGNVAQTYALEQGNAALPRNLVFNNYNRLPDMASMAALGLCLRLVLKGFNSLPLGAVIDRYSNFPTSQPSAQPSSEPTGEPSSQPSAQPSSMPSFQPSEQPSSRPSAQPASRPTSQPSRQPTSQPTDQISAAKNLQQNNKSSAPLDNAVHYEEYVSEAEMILSIATAVVSGISVLAGTIGTCCSIRSRASSIAGAADILIKHGNHGALENVISNISAQGGGVDEARELQKIKNVFDSPQCCSFNMQYRAEDFQGALRKMSNGARGKLVDNLSRIMDGGGERIIDESDLRNRLIAAVSPSPSPASGCGVAMTGMGRYSSL